MTNILRSLVFLPALVIAALMLGAGVARAEVPAPPCGPGTCSAYELSSDDAVDPIAACLVAWGWRGVPGDGLPRIYAPTSVIEVAIEVCGQARV